MNLLLHCMAMAVAMSMDFRVAVLHLISASFLLLVISVLPQQQIDPCSPDGGDDGKCGLNGICLVNTDNSVNCSCPPGFQFVDNTDFSKGCVPKPSQQLGCNSSGAEMQEVDQIDWGGNDYAHITPMNQTACKQACMKDCFCTVVIYADVSGIETCWKKAMPLRNGRVSITRTAYFKVYNAVPGTVPPTPSAFPPTPSAAVPPTPSGAVPPTPSGALPPMLYNKSSVPPTSSGFPPAPFKASPHMPSKKTNGMGNGKAKMLVIFGITLVGCSSVFAAILLLIWLYMCIPKLRAMKENHKFNSGLKAYSYQEIDTATKGFKHEIGRGAFGKVYKGVLPDGKAIAVKKLDKLDRDGQENIGEKRFRTEMSIIGASHHKNLVQLYGFCDEGSHRILVYEYMPNGSLDSILFEGKSDLAWDRRVRIASGTARGILYLHEECRTHIVHCDIKPQNILLDENYNAKISDFGIARLIGAEQTRTFTLTRGTMGYMAPEWQKNMIVSVKVDVYSLGVVLLEIVCCRKMLDLGVSTDEILLSDWVYNCLKYGRLLNLVEQQHCRDIEPIRLERMVLVGLWCIQQNPSLRPSIKKVVQMLEGTVEIAVPPDPGSS